MCGGKGGGFEGLRGHDKEKRVEDSQAHGANSGEVHCTLAVARASMREEWKKLLIIGEEDKNVNRIQH